MKTPRFSALRTRTEAERETINERARTWPRPLSATQRSALKLLGEARLIVTCAGWQQFGGSSLDLVTTQTLESLERRELASFKQRGGYKRKRVAHITRKGQDLLRRL